MHGLHCIQNIQKNGGKNVPLLLCILNKMPFSLENTNFGGYRTYIQRVWEGIFFGGREVLFYFMALYELYEKRKVEGKQLSRLGIGTIKAFLYTQKSQVRKQSSKKSFQKLNFLR